MLGADDGIGSWPPISRSESGAISASIPSTPSPSWWPRRRTRPGPGTSPSCWGRPSGRTLPLRRARHLQPLRESAGWSQTGRTRRWPVVDHRRDLPTNRASSVQVLTLHSDRGAPMTSKCTAQLLADLGVTRSLSRPQVSDDNPFSEAQFKTLTPPGFPGRFHDITAAIAFCRTFFPYPYNTEPPWREPRCSATGCTRARSRLAVDLDIFPETVRSSAGPLRARLPDPSRAATNASVPHLRERQGRFRRKPLRGSTHRVTPSVTRCVRPPARNRTHRPCGRRHAARNPPGRHPSRPCPVRPQRFCRRFLW